MESKNNNFTGTWIHKEVFELGKMPGNERIILSIIINLENEEKGCYASNKYFANILQISKKQVSKYISNLFDKELITSEILIEEGNKRILRSLLTTPDNPIQLKDNTYPQKGGYPTPFIGDTSTPKGGNPILQQGDAYNKVDTKVYTKDERELSHIDFLKSIYNKQWQDWEKENRNKIMDYQNFAKAFNNDMTGGDVKKNDKLINRLIKYSRHWIRNQKESERPESKPNYLRNVM